MKVKKTKKKYCRKCKKSTEQTIALAKQGGRNKTHPMSYGSRKRMRKRGEDRGFGNKGKVSRGAVSSWKRHGAKTSKKITLKLTCKECQKSTIQVLQRAKKVEME